MLACDEAIVDPRALSRCEIQWLSTGDRELRFVRRVPPIPSYWEGVIRLPKPHRDASVRLESQGPSPDLYQLKALDDLRERFFFFFGNAMFLLRPAFSVYLRDAEPSRSLDEEFVCTALFIGSIHRQPVTWEALFRSWSDPRFSFVVRFSGPRAVQLLVDRSVDPSSAGGAQ